MMRRLPHTTSARSVAALWRRSSSTLHRAVPLMRTPVRPLTTQTWFGTGPRLSALSTVPWLRSSKPDDPKGQKDEKKGDDDDDDADDEGGPDMNHISRVAFHTVMGITVASVVLYYFSLPSGDAVTWARVMQKAQEISSVAFYDRYAQIYFDDAPNCFVGLNPEDNRETQFSLDQVESRRSGTQSPIDVYFAGQSYPEKMLLFVGLVAWVFPFLFTPLYVTFLSQATGVALRSSLRMMGKAQGEADKTADAAKLFKVTQQTHIKFRDIAGMAEPKHEVAEIVDFLKNPDRYVKMGAKIPSGAMLLGPPGTGKTLLAKAVAGESNVAFIPCVGSDFVEMWVGMGALRVRKLFELAKKQEKCIIYIDEIDAIGMKRGMGFGGEKQEQEHTLNELLTQLDGFNSANDRVIVLASSNVEQSQLDPALIRPGRFDRLVHVDAPVLTERVDIFRYHLEKLRLTPDSESPAETKAADAPSEDESSGGGGTPMPVDRRTKPVLEIQTPPIMQRALAGEADEDGIASATTSTPEPAASPTSSGTSIMVRTQDDQSAKPEERGETPETESPVLSDKQRLITSFARRMSDLCPGFVGADIANVCNEAAILAARNGDDVVKIDHLEKSIDRVLAGIEHRSRVLSSFEKTVVAHHEAGHAVAGWFLNRADPLMKVSIVPRGGKALGYAQYLPNENMQRSADDIMDSICVTLGGRVAEKIFFDHLSTGASDDLQKVTRMAYSYVSSFNTSAAYAPPGTSSTAYVKPFGEKTGQAIDDAAKALVDRAYQRTYDLLLSHKADMERLAERLLENEILTHADVVELLGQRPDKQRERRYV